MTNKPIHYKIVLQKRFYLVWILTVLLLFSFVGYILYLKKDKSYAKSAERIANNIDRKLDQLYNSKLGELPKSYLPVKLEKIATALKFPTLVKSVKSVHVRGIQNPYNSSIVKAPNGNYFLFYRMDHHKAEPISNPRLPLESYIGVVELDKNFSQISPSKIINTYSKNSEDPRAFLANGRLFLSYNDLVPSSVYGRSIRLCELDPASLETKYITDLNLGMQLIEKNWMPFVKSSSGDDLGIHFVYSMNPHKILSLNDPKEGLLSLLPDPEYKTLSHLIWKSSWGVLRGGTPAQLHNGEYLAFFHSSFKDKKTNTNWYVMGAYTFDKEVPHKITSISREPILFRNVYDSEHGPGTNEKLRCLFPSGFVIDENNIHVSCGENDSQSKIITIDYDILKKSMQKIVLDHSNEKEVAFYEY